ncbi:MAG: glycosyltransferase [Candidatus Cloacimonadaceae bacterium]
MMSDKIKICHFSTVHPRTDVRIFYKECISLAKNGYDVHLVVADGKGNDIIKSVKIHDIGTMPNRFLRIVINPIRMFFQVLRLHCKIYHFHDPELLLIGLLLKIFTSAKVVYDAHECYSEFFLQKEYIPNSIRKVFVHGFKQFERFIGKQLDEVITTTEFQAEKIIGINRNLDLISNYPLLEEWESIQTENYSKKEKAICYIGSISEERGITQVIKAIENIDCTFHLAGSYAYPQYRNKLIHLPGWKKVIEHGFVNRQQAADIIVRSLVGVVLLLPKPNHLISHSTKIFEYMAGGIACLVPNFPMWKEIVEKNACGICVDTTDLTEIINALQYLLENPQICMEMGKIGRQLVREKYNWNTQETALLSIYRRLLTS